MGEDRGIRKEEREKKVDEGIFGFSKVIVDDSCSSRPICHVRVMYCTIPSILTRFWPQGVTIVQLD